MFKWFTDLFRTETDEIETTKARLKELVDLLMKYGLDSPKLKEFVHKHSEDPEFQRLAHVIIEIKCKSV